MPNLPSITRALLIANVAFFLLQQISGPSIEINFALWPLGQTHWERIGGVPVSVGFEFWQLVTYAFLHGSVAHIVFNMFALWMFGAPVEHALGARRYGLYYIVCVIGAAVAQLAVIHYFKPDDFYATLGASGGVFGILLAFAMIYPTARIVAFPIFVPLPAPILVVGYMVVELVLGITGTQEGVAHFAHLGGAAAGFAMLRIWRAQAMNRRE